MPPLLRGLILLLVVGTSAQAAEPARLLLIGQGPDGHPPGTHEFMKGVRIMEHLFGRHPDIALTSAKADEPWPEGPALIDQSDGVVLFLTQGACWMRQNPDRYQALKRLLDRKGGVVALHWAVGAKDAEYIDTALEIIGGCHGGPDRKYVKEQATIHVVNPAHPVTTGLADLRIQEEFYYRLKFVMRREELEPVLSVMIDGNEETCAWAWSRPDGGRSFGFVGLHYHDNWREEFYRRLVVQSVRWTLSMPTAETGYSVEVPSELLE